MSVALKQTLGNPDWVIANRDALRKVGPEEWTHVHQVNALHMRWCLKIAGVDYRTEDEFKKCLEFLIRVGIIENDGGLRIRRCPA